MSLRCESSPPFNIEKTYKDFIFVDDICCGLISYSLKGTSEDVDNIPSGDELTIKGWPN